MRETLQESTAEMRMLNLEELRHELSNGKALVTTALNLATSDAPDVAEARDLFKIGN